MAAVRLFRCRHLRAPLRGRGQPPHLRRAALWRRKRRLRAKEEPPLPRVARRSRAALCAPCGACPSAFSRHSAACGRLRALRLSLRGGAGCPAPCPFGGLGCAAPLWSCACGGARLRLSVLAWAGALRPSAAAVRLVPRRSLRVGGLCPRTCSPRAAPLLAWSWSVCVTEACDGRSPPRLFPAPLGVGRGAPSPSAVPLCSACRVGGFPVPVVRGAALPSPSLRGVAALLGVRPARLCSASFLGGGGCWLRCVRSFRLCLAGLSPSPPPVPLPLRGRGKRPACGLAAAGRGLVLRGALRRAALLIKIARQKPRKSHQPAGVLPSRLSASRCTHPRFLIHQRNKTPLFCCIRARYKYIAVPPTANNPTISASNRCSNKIIVLCRWWAECCATYLIFEHLHPLSPLL